LERAPHAAAAHPLAARLQVTPFCAGSLTAIAVRLADLFSSTVCADGEMLTKIGGGALAEPPPQPMVLAARATAAKIPTSVTRFFDLITDLLIEIEGLSVPFNSRQPGLSKAAMCPSPQRS